jgi:hypothetical protein
MSATASGFGALETLSGEGSITIFLASCGRPVYLWQCLDALWRHTDTATRVVLLDNADPSPLVGEVIEGFQRRGLFAEVVRFPTNSWNNLRTAYRERLDGVGAVHVYMESDAVIQAGAGCWLATMTRILAAHPWIGMLGSLVDPGDFVSPETALALTGGDGEAAAFLAKLNSPERAFLGSSVWTEASAEFFITEPPFPLANPPGRLLLLRSDAMKEIEALPDWQLAEAFRARGMRPAVTPLVRHRHLSLLNIYDYQRYSGADRDTYFHAGTLAPAPEAEG